MEITFWGVRGCIPAAGAEFVRYGGNTSCVSVRGEDGALLVLDAGTGIIELGRKLTTQGYGFGGSGGEVSLFLTHAHWDHVQGFPFFAPVFVPGNRITIHGSSRSPGMLEGIFEGQMNPHFMPVQSLRNLGAAIDFKELDAGDSCQVGGISVRGAFNQHGRVQAFAFRLQEGDRSIVYAPDADYPEGEVSEAIAELYRDADLLIHDSTYTPEDRATRLSRGYSSIDVTARVAAQARVKRLAMFHYDQDYTDDDLDLLVTRCRAMLDAEPNGHEVELIAARDGLTLVI